MSRRPRRRPQPSCLGRRPEGESRRRQATCGNRPAAAGREYRLGLVNAPEVGACFAAEATTERQRLLQSGFQADVYATDGYGRSVALITTAGGVNVNVDLARRGYVDDRYLSRFRHENPQLARSLDQAFMDAKNERAGLWGACTQASSSWTSSADRQTDSTVARGGSGPGSRADGAYRSCAEARARGGAPVHRGEPGYGGHLDGDSDGTACE